MSAARSRMCRVEAAPERAPTATLRSPAFQRKVEIPGQEREAEKFLPRVDKTDPMIAPPPLPPDPPKPRPRQTRAAEAPWRAPSAARAARAPKPARRKASLARAGLKILGAIFLFFLAFSPFLAGFPELPGWAWLLIIAFYVGTFFDRIFFGRAK